MSPESALLPLAASIADGSTIDWQAAEASASPEDRAVVRQLQLLAGVASLHRSLAASPDTARAVHRGPGVAAIGTWGHLVLMERIGEGAFGEVYRAWDQQLERDVALKLLRTERGQEASRLTIEGRLLARVRHPNVITVYGVGVHGDRVGFWMELIRGVTLEQQLAAQGPFSAREAALTGIDLCRALAALHGVGLVHRDVKTQNVMREAGGRILLMDLGTCRELEQVGTQAGPQLAGTPLSLAPEIFEGAPASARTDLYSLGVLLYHLVSGSFPVRARSLKELHEAHADGRVVHLRDARADLPSGFVRVIDRAIAHDPEQRYDSAGALEADLIRALDDTVESGVPAPAAPRRLQPTRRGLLLGAAAAALMALAAGLWWSYAGRAVPAAGIRSVAVLPLANLSGDPSQEYFADGMTDELIGTLGQLEGLNVISRTSVMRFKGTDASLPEIARALNVDAILEGSAVILPGGRDDERRVRISARLVHAGTDVQVWNRTFEAVAADVLGLRSEVAAAVADGINFHLTSQQETSLKYPRRGRAQGAGGPEFETYDLYLKGRYYWNMRTPDGLKQSVRYFQEAIARDARYAPAYAGLADAYYMMGIYGVAPVAETNPLARTAALKALELDDSLAEAHASLALMAQDEFKWEVAESRFQRALELKPGYATTHHWYSDYLAKQGRLEEASSAINRAVTLDPLSVSVNGQAGIILLLARRYDEAIEQLEKTLGLDPRFFRAHLALANAYALKSEFDRAFAELDSAERAGATPDEVRTERAYLLAVSGRHREARRIANELAEFYRTSSEVPPSDLAVIHIGLNDLDRAFELLERARELGDQSLVYLAVDPRYDHLRTDPRFKRLIASMGLDR